MAVLDVGPVAYNVGLTGSDPRSVSLICIYYRPKSLVGLVWGSAAAWRCPTFVWWTGCIVAVTCSRWQHHKHRPGIVIIIIVVIIIITNTVSRTSRLRWRDIGSERWRRRPPTSDCFHGTSAVRRCRDQSGSLFGTSTPCSTQVWYVAVTPTCSSTMILPNWSTTDRQLQTRPTRSTRRRWNGTSRASSNDYKLASKFASSRGRNFGLKSGDADLRPWVQTDTRWDYGYPSPSN